MTFRPTPSGPWVISVQNTWSLSFLPFWSASHPLIQTSGGEEYDSRQSLLLQNEIKKSTEKLKCDTQLALLLSKYGSTEF